MWSTRTCRAQAPETRQHVGHEVLLSREQVRHEAHEAGEQIEDETHRAQEHERHESAWSRRHLGYNLTDSVQATDT